ncbi:MAG: hypothetical protein E3J64_02200, partial [Anaerolineales bacterium]
MRSPVRTIVLVWLTWVLVVIGYQTVVAARLELERPDRVLSWTARETTETALDDEAYLIEPFL